MTLKDNISTKGILTTCASKMLEHYVPVYDAAVWQRLQEEHAVLLGKTNLDEFAMGSSGETSYYGATQNPVRPSRPRGEFQWDSRRGGGKPGGIWIGVRYRRVDPSAGVLLRDYRGKATYGAVSRRGLIAHASGLDQIGPLCATVEDAAIVLDAISFCDPQDSTSVRAPRKTCVEQLGKEISGIRFGVVEQYDRGTIQEVDQAMEEAAEILESLGAKRVNLKLPALPVRAAGLLYPVLRPGGLQFGTV